MKRMRAVFACGVAFFGALFGAGGVSAYNYNIPSEFEAGGPTRTGFKMCVKSDVLGTQNYMYIWNSGNNNDALAAWPGVRMEDDGSGVYCHTITEQENRYYNFVIFNNDSGKQTIDLSVVNDTNNLVNSLVYLFNENDMIKNGKYKGRWVVNDTSALEAMVSVAKSLDASEYTIASYSAVIAALGSDVSVSDVNVDNQDQYDLGADYISKLNIENDVLNKLYVLYDGGTGHYSSAYLDAYNALGEALNNLVERKAIVIDDNIQNGGITAAYKPNSDSEIDIEATPHFGYELESIVVKEILSYDELNNPIFGSTTDIAVESDKTEYDYALGDSDIKGVYISATFKAKLYHIVFVVGENGEIRTIGGENIESPVTVYYGDDYSLKVVANEGYEVDTILVNGEEYEMVGGILTIKNIAGDVEVEVSFKIKPGDDGGIDDGIDNGVDNKDSIAVPDTGRTQSMHQVVVGSLVGCVLVGAILGGVLGFTNRKKISKYLKK